MDFSKLFEKDLNQLFKGNQFSITEWEIPELDLIYTCQACKKKIGLERRFVEPLNEKEVICPYCDAKLRLVLPKEDDTN